MSDSFKIKIYKIWIQVLPLGNRNYQTSAELIHPLKTISFNQLNFRQYHIKYKIYSSIFQKVAHWKIVWLIRNI